MTIQRLERTNDPVISFLAAFQGLQSSLWTALPGRIEGYDAAKGTVAVQPTIQARYTDEKGVQSWLTLPLLVDVPVMFPNAGGFSLTFPVVEGDECLVIFASRCIDVWWDTGNVSVQSDLRMHDLSDGFALIGPRSRPRVLPDVSTTSVELRNDEHSAFIQIDPAGKITLETDGTVKVKAAVIDGEATTSATVKAPTITLDGDVTVTGSLSVTGNTNLHNTSVIGGLVNNGTDVGATHKHTGGTIAGMTGVPTP